MFVTVILWYTFCIMLFIFVVLFACFLCIYVSLYSCLLVLYRVQAKKNFALRRGVLLRYSSVIVNTHHRWVDYRVTVLDGFSPISTLFVVQFRLEISFALSAGHVIYARPWGIKPAVECTSTQRERERMYWNVL